MEANRLFFGGLVVRSRPQRTLPSSFPRAMTSVPWRKALPTRKQVTMSKNRQEQTHPDLRRRRDPAPIPKQACLSRLKRLAIKLRSASEE